MSVTRPTENAITPELLTAEQAAQLAGVSPRTIWRWSRSGLSPRPLLIGHGRKPAVRYRRSDMIAWIESGCPRCDAKQGGNR